MRESNICITESLRPSLGAQHAENHSNLAPRLSSTLSVNGGSSLRSSDSRLAASVLQIAGENAGSRPIPSGGECAPRAGSSNGSNVSSTRGRSRDGSPRFDQDVNSGGYLWWYVDAMSDDGQFGLSLIAFVGSVFSPYYAREIRKGVNPDPENHCALNVALYTPQGKLWAMTERPKESVFRNKQEFVIGSSCVSWDGRALHIDIDEWSVPLFKKIKGRVSVYPEQLYDFSTPLDPKALHHWGPIAPASRVEVNLNQPHQSWSGHAYVDSNEGVEPIAKTFTEWDWNRAHLADGTCVVVYDCQFHHDKDNVLALRFHKSGEIEPFKAPARRMMKDTAWKMSRRIRSEHDLGSIRQLEDTPFYQRAVVDNNLCGERVKSFHETLNAVRFDSGWVQALLPWRMPRLYKPRLKN